MKVRERKSNVGQNIALVIMFILAFVIADAKAEYIDLSQGGMIISEMVRCDEERPLVCVVVLYEKKRYLVVHDTKGEYRIYLLDGDELKLIWAREII